jgi:exodeoxyribonuclease VII small subunit
MKKKVEETKEKYPDLETSLKEINVLVEKMEHGELNLEQSLNHFGRGIELIKHCQKILQEAEQKVQILMQSGEQAALQPFNPNKDQEVPSDHDDRVN